MYLKLAWRNLWRNRRRTIITVSSVTFAVLFSVLTLSVNRGSHNNMIDNMARFHTGFIQVQDALYEDEPSLDNTLLFDDELASQILQSHQEIDFIVPRIETFMLAAGENQTRGAMVSGVDLQQENRLNDLETHLVEGNFFREERSTVIGVGLANRLNVVLNDTLVLLGQGRFGMTAAEKYPIGGLVDHPITEFNDQIVYLKLQDAQYLLSAEKFVTSVLVIPSEVGYTDEVAEALKTELEDDVFNILTWPEMMPELLQAIEFDRAGGYVMLGILYVVIAFGLFGTILTMTLERLREFGVLLSIGVQRFQLISILFIETVIIGFIGVLMGCGLGFLMTYYFHLNPPELSGDAAETMLEMGFEPVLPFSMAPDIYYTQGIIIFLLSLGICLYPAIKIIRLNILDAART
ncbi:MAG: FtsX-like permease family protein [Balneolaceae bacterium]